MSPNQPVIPARLELRALAEVLDMDPERLRAALAQVGHEADLEDVIGADIAMRVAEHIGRPVTVEPRDLALERLYEYETRGELADEPGGRAGELVDGVVTSLDEIDDMIESVSEHWSVARMPVIDRNIIRLAVHELTSEPSVPAAVILSEAVRLAQTYSTEKSGSFVNGILATLARTVRPG